MIPSPCETPEQTMGLDAANLCSVLLSGIGAKEFDPHGTAWQSHERYLDDNFAFCVAPPGLKCNSDLLPHAEARG
jgi:hypothetical protein